MNLREGELEELGVRLADEVKTTVMRPGDTLVLSMPRRITDMEYHHMVDVIHEYVPGVKVLIFPEAGDVRVFRPDGEKM
jgi:hypothetical protein